MSSAPGMTASDWLSQYPPPRSLTLDQEAARVYQRAYYIGDRVEDKTDPPITFTTLAAALLEGEDDTSKWFADVARRLGPRKDAVFANKNISPAILAETARQGWPPPDGIRLSSDTQLLTSSSREVLENAENWAQRVAGSDIGVRHLVASYVVNPPPYHRDQLKKWGLDESQWRAEFFEWVSRRFTWEQWVDASQRAAPSPTRVTFEQQEVKGSSLAWPGDPASLSILEEAAERHLYRSDSALAFMTLVFALIERAREDFAIGDSVLPLMTAVDLLGETYHDFAKAYFATTAREEEKRAFADCTVSRRVLDALETARQLATTARLTPVATDTSFVTPQHILGALLSRNADGDEDLAALGIDVPELRRAVLQHVSALGLESTQVWSEVLGQPEELTAGRPVDLNSDEPEAVVRLDEKWIDDPLVIRRDVEVFASLLASRDLEPPLSIGLFGPWGSGKTTFLKRLRRAVQRHADDARSDGATRGPYVPNVVHVEFNAWHFSEGALISSLVDATIRQIAGYIKNLPNLGPKGWLDDKLKALESRQRQVAAATELQNAAQEALTAAQTRLATSEAQAKLSATSLKSAVGAVWKATTAALANDDVVKGSGVLEAVGGTVQDLGELQQRVEKLRARPGRLLGDLGWSRSVLFAALILFVPPAVALLVGRVTQANDLEKLLSSLTAILAVLGIWARTAAAAVSNVDKAAARVVAEYERRVSTDTSVATAQVALDTARANAQTAAAGLDAARHELARAQADAANASLPAQTLQLATTRIEDRSYAKELTTLSLARADLESLSLILREQRTDTGTENGGLRAVDRVILYIDDLDRCKPADVVRVLQLVHMLLAFELFVVVVAVDARWVEQSLRDSYPWLADGKGKAEDTLGYVTPEDYLEKIFQIAFWLEPMTAGHAASYLRSLVRPRAANTPAAGSDGKVEVTIDELDYMRALSAFVGSSPRRVKRLVNAYRLIKSRLSDAQLKAFVAHGAGPYQIVIGLLVIGTGAQSSSSQILGELGELDPKDTYAHVVEEFGKRGEPDWNAAARVIETIMRSQKATDVFELRGWARQVGRFLLHGPIADLRPRATPPPATT